MLRKEKCVACQGSGVRMVETSSFLGLVKKQTPITCDQCDGVGFKVILPECVFCEGQGLVGNERSICRACNGTGRIDTFGFIPRDKIKVRTTFDRRCDLCGERQFEVTSNIEQHKETRSWEKEAELRQIEVVEKVKVRCLACGQSYYIPVSPEAHEPISTELMGDLEDLGIDLSFMYRKD